MMTVQEVFQCPAPVALVTGSGAARVGRSQEMPLRFYINGNRYVSGRARDHRRL